jgi:hypothetical protein
MSGNYWVNPPPGNNTSDDTFIQGLWVVGEQRNLSWVTAVESSTNLSLIQDEMDPGLGSISIYYKLIIFNYAILNQTNIYDHFRNSCHILDWL